MAKGIIGSFSSKSLSNYLHGLKNYRFSNRLHIGKRQAFWIVGSTALLIAPVAYAIDNTQPDLPVDPPQTSAQINSESSNQSPDVSNNDSKSLDTDSAVNTDQSTSGDQSNTSTTSVTVNGQNIDVPDNGNVTKNISNGNNNTSIHISTSHSTTGDGSNGSSRSTTTINQHTSSNTQSIDESSQ